MPVIEGATPAAAGPRSHSLESWIGMSGIPVFSETCPLFDFGWLALRLWAFEPMVWPRGSCRDGDNCSLDGELRTSGPPQDLTPQSRPHRSKYASKLSLCRQGRRRPCMGILFYGCIGVEALSSYIFAELAPTVDVSLSTPVTT